MALRTKRTCCSGVLIQHPCFWIIENAPESSRTGTVASRGSDRYMPARRCLRGHDASKRPASMSTGPHAFPSQAHLAS